MTAPIGFMQGRLSPMIDGRIQAFPWTCWQTEFSIAQKHGFHLMEWTLDQFRLYENPLLTPDGRSEIRALCQRHEIAIPSLTGDCFMQAPFWKAENVERGNLKQDFHAVAEASAAVGISIIVVPLVDSGRLEDARQEDTLVAFLERQTKFLSHHGLRVAFECDYSPKELARLAGRLDPEFFGINYDIGNSAALGFDPADEIAAYGNRIVNVHIKDRLLSGTTVPLGDGNADFEAVFFALARVGYAGNYILQTARAINSDHAGALCRYRDMVESWLNVHAT
jgi:L-ribulose-5-phosphate 3-epimerase